MKINPVIVIAAFVSGDQRVAKEIESFGTNAIYIYRFDPQDSTSIECRIALTEFHTASRPFDDRD